MQMAVLNTPQPCCALPLLLKGLLRVHNHVKSGSYALSSLCYMNRHNTAPQSRERASGANKSPHASNQLAAPQRPATQIADIAYKTAFQQGPLARKAAGLQNTVTTQQPSPTVHTKKISKHARQRGHTAALASCAHLKINRHAGQHGHAATLASCAH